MSKDQINELAADIYSMLRVDAMSRALASLLYGNGWRKLLINDVESNNSEVISNKQEWISVTERLPEPNMLVLAILDEPCLRLNFPFKEQVLILLRERLPYSVGIVEEWRRPFSSETINYDGRVTHWMPLPEPPMMKGGAE